MKAADTEGVKLGIMAALKGVFKTDLEISVDAEGPVNGSHHGTTAREEVERMSKEAEALIQVLGDKPQIHDDAEEKLLQILRQVE